MFRHLLVPTDGSEFSHLAVDQALEMASEDGCDLIFMASHGPRALAGLVLGSETQRVLTHAELPVLVYPGRGQD